MSKNGFERGKRHKRGKRGKTLKGCNQNAPLSNCGFLEVWKRTKGNNKAEEELAIYGKRKSRPQLDSKGAFVSTLTAKTEKQGNCLGSV